MLWSLTLIVLLPCLCLGDMLCPDGKISCPEGKACCPNEGIYTCCDSEVINGIQGIEPKLSEAAMIRNTSNLQNAFWSTTPRYCAGTWCFDGSCCAYAQATCCGSNRCCQYGNNCCSGGMFCCPTTSICCGSRSSPWCCPSGTICSSSYNTCTGSTTKCGGGVCYNGEKCCSSGKGKWCCNRNLRCSKTFMRCWSCALTPTLAIIVFAVLASLATKFHFV